MKDLPGPKPKLWRGYRNCNRCSRWRPVSDFPIRKTRIGYEQITGICQACIREQEQHRYASLSWEGKQEVGRRANRNARKRKKKQLTFIERQRKILDEQNEELERMHEKYQRVRNRYIMRGVNGDEPIAVEITPFRMWLLRQYRLRNYDLAALAEEMGQDGSRVRRWLDGFYWNGTGRDPEAIRTITIATLDEIAVALDDPGLLERLYPLETD